MGQVTLELPNMLHKELQEEADREGIAFEQFLLFVLTKHTKVVYVGYPLTQDSVEQQKNNFKNLLKRLGSTSNEFVQKALDSREEAPLDQRLDADLSKKLDQKIRSLRGDLN
jgi:hypothetical protein